jgi:hypothetical protein
MAQGRHRDLFLALTLYLMTKAGLPLCWQLSASWRPARRGRSIIVLEGGSCLGYLLAWLLFFYFCRLCRSVTSPHFPGKGPQLVKESFQTLYVGDQAVEQSVGKRGACYGYQERRHLLQGEP